MLVAFSTSSSAADLPVTMEQCRVELHFSDEVTSFVLPLGATLHMNDTAMFLSVAAVFLAQAFGQPLDASDLLSIVAISLIGSVGAVAIPSIGVVFLVVIQAALADIGLPGEPARGSGRLGSGARWARGGLGGPLARPRPARGRSRR